MLFLRTLIINIDTLRKECRRYLKFSQENQSVSSPQKPTENNQEERTKRPKNRQDEFVLYFKNNSPVQVLRDISDGAEPSSQDVQIIENILIQQKLPCSVLNVLLHYVLLRI